VKALLKRLQSAAITVPFLMGASGLAMGAVIGGSWSKSDVTPVVLVKPKPGIGGFEPVDGSSIGNTWPKSEVKAVLLVTPGIGGFEPREGISIGNTWRKQDILPVMLVEPSGGSFIPLRALTTGSESTGYPSAEMPKADEVARLASTDALRSPSVIETQIDGDFKGWEGETIVKLMDGHIWQQSEYYYEYYYAFMPKVLIFKSGDGYKMKVDGVEKPIGVKQLK